MLRKLIGLLRGLFTTKEESPPRRLPKEEVIGEPYKSPPFNIVEYVLEKTKVRDKGVTSAKTTGKESFDVLDYIRKHRKEIIKDKEERKLKILPKTSEGYWIQLDKKMFLFDEEGWKLFEEEFDNPSYELFVNYAKKSYYLGRVNKENGHKKFFHRMFMWSEILDYASKKGVREFEVDIHHKQNCFDNRRENLVPLTRSEHEGGHSK
jgi:hypothetical protein